MILFFILSLNGIFFSIILGSEVIFTFSLIGIIVTVSYVFAIIYVENLKRNSELEIESNNEKYEIIKRG